MANRARNTTVALTVILLMASHAHADTRRVRIRICYGDAPTAAQVGVVEAATRQATAIYAAVGISLEWTSGAVGETDGDALQLTAQVLSGRGTSRIVKNSPHLPPSVLGVAPAETARVYLFSDRIVQRARRDGVTVDRVFGRVLAHEIGHHLLPAQGHSSTGLMRASLDYKAPMAPTFTDAQIESIRTLQVGAR